MEGKDEQNFTHIIVLLFSLTIISCGSDDGGSSASTDNTSSTTTSDDDSTTDNSTSTDDTTTDTTAPTVTSFSATAITTGFAHTCALLDNASVKCWGYNGVGGLGIDNSTHMGDNSGEMDLLIGIDL